MGGITAWLSHTLYRHADMAALFSLTLQLWCADSSWGAVKYVRQNEAALLSEADAAIVAKARDLYGEAVEASLASAPKGSTGVVGDTVRQAFAQVAPCCRGCAGRKPHPGLQHAAKMVCNL